MKKKRINGRAKGGRFERTVAKLIIEAFQDRGITADDCFRTPLSGGHRFASKKDPGDHQISQLLRRWYPFCNECKDRATPHWVELFQPSAQTVKVKQKRSGGEKFIDWWVQACTAADAQQQPPLVIFKGRLTEIYAIGRVSDLKCVPNYVPLLVTRINGDRVRLVLFRQLLEALSN